MARSTSPSTTRKLSNPTADQPRPDAALLRLMAEHTKAQACVEAGEILLEADPGSMSETAFYRLCDKVSDIEDAILTQPTHTPEGLGIKARIAARYMQSPADWGLRTYDVFGLFVESVLRLTAHSRREASGIAMRPHTMAGRS
jgi:hypothetical protein